MKWSIYRERVASGIHWIGDLPRHWQVKRLGQITLFLQTGPFGSQLHASDYVDEGIPVINPIHYQQGVIRSDHGSYVSECTANRLSRHRLEDGDIVMARRGDLGRCALVEPEHSGWVCGTGSALVRPRPEEVASEFLALALSQRGVAEFLALSAVGATMPNLNISILSEIPCPLPPRVEQDAIVTFLDRETTKLDTLIAKQERLIELLQEKRQALISHAVTKGLNLDASMKNSGVEWLGAVPAHWMQRRLGHMFRQCKRQGHDSKEVLSVYRDYGVIKKDTRSDNLNKTPDDLSLYQLVNVRDLVVNKMKAWQGSLGISAVEGITSPDYIVFKPDHSESDEYLHLLLRSRPMVAFFFTISNGIRPAQWRLEPDSFAASKVFLPPIDEQRAIVAFIDREVTRVDTLIAQCSRSIDLMREHRAALISAAVTGKIDVREIVMETA